MLEKTLKTEIIKEFGRSENDTGSCDVQIALLSRRIKEISEHLQKFPKDKHSRRGLLKLVARRKTYMSYLKRSNNERFEFVVKKLESK